MNKQLLNEFEDLKNRVELLTEAHLDAMTVYSQDAADELKRIWGDKLGAVVVANPQVLRNLSGLQIDKINSDYLKAGLGLPMELFEADI